MGLIEVVVTAEPIDPRMIAQWKPSQRHGAMNFFIGMVRSSNLGRDVVAVEYDCYIPLCETTFSQIARETLEKWEVDANVLIVHRHGKLKVGEISVAIVASTSHRDESYKITRYIIEEIKTRAPIWKKEYYIDGETEWVRGHALCQHRKVDHHELNGNHSCGGKVHSHETR